MCAAKVKAAKPARKSEKAKVRDWLMEHGASLEMRVSSQFRGKGFWTSLGEHYDDPNEPKRREIDVVAQLSRSDPTARDWGLAIRFIVECKHSFRPWVVFSDTREHDFGLSAVCTDDNGDKGYTLQNNLHFHQMKGLGTFYRVADRVGYSMATAFIPDCSESEEPGTCNKNNKKDTKNNKKDTAHDAMAQVVSAVKGFRLSTGGGFLGPPTSRIATLTIPLIVLQGSLYRVIGGSSARKFDLKSITSARLAWKRESSFSIDVVTYAGLPAYLDSVVADINVLCETCEAEPRWLLEENFGLSKSVWGLQKGPVS